MSQKLAVGIISFNRPHYLRQLVDSLEMQSDLDVDFHFFQDGAVNKFSKREATDKRFVDESIKIFIDSELPNKNSYISKENLGIAINQYQAKNILANNYKHFLILEDDLVLSPHYIRLVKVLANQFDDRDDVFSVSLNFLCREPIHTHLNAVGFMNEHWWAECYNADKWKKVRSHFDKYYRFVNNRDYQKRPHTLIKAFFRDAGMNIPQTSQDAGMDYAVREAGLKRINSYVNRGLYIGIKGTHFNERLAEKYEFDKQVPFYFASDANLIEFELR